jgi:Flp pilus assembly protein TadB
MNDLGKQLAGGLQGRHWMQFLLLALVYLIGIFIYFCIPDFTVRRVIAVALAILYPVWGIWHHHERGHLRFSIIAEYTLVGLIILVGLLTLL